jgi:hypothetical protein
MALAHQELDAPSEEGLIAEASLEAEGIDFTEMRRLARLHGLRAEIESPIDAPTIAAHLSQGKTVIAQIDRFPIDSRQSYHAVIILGFSEETVTFLDPLATDTIPPGERTIARELFGEAHLLTLVCDLPS